MSIINLVGNFAGLLLNSDDFQLSPMDETLVPEFKNKYEFGSISILEVIVSSPSVITKTPIETGKLIGDSRIIMPREAKVTIGLPSAVGDDYLAVMGSAFSALKDIFAQGIVPSPLYEKVVRGINFMYYNNVAFSIKTKTDLLTNMYLTDFPHSFTVDALYRVVFTLNFSEVLEATESGVFSPDSPDDTPLSSLGTKIAKKFSGALSAIGIGG